MNLKIKEKINRECKVDLLYCNAAGCGNSGFTTYASTVDTAVLDFGNNFCK